MKYVLGLLHHHHVGEDELLWPRLSGQTRFHLDLLARTDSRHQDRAVLLDDAATASAEWQDAPAEDTSTLLVRGPGGLVPVPITRRLVVLGYLLEGATPRERTGFLAAIPRPARLAYRLIGARRHRRGTTRLRGPPRP